jgi:hypothetical protein
MPRESSSPWARWDILRLSGLIDHFIRTLVGQLRALHPLENYPISDGSMPNLAISTMAGRDKTTYGFALIPDEAERFRAGRRARGPLAPDQDMPAPQTRIR